MFDVLIDRNAGGVLEYNCHEPGKAGVIFPFGTGRVAYPAVERKLDVVIGRDHLGIRILRVTIG